MMITIVYEDEDDYVMKEGIVAVIDLKYKKQIRVVDKIIPIRKNSKNWFIIQRKRLWFSSLFLILKFLF